MGERHSLSAGLHGAVSLDRESDDFLDMYADEVVES